MTNDHIIIVFYTKLFFSGSNLDSLSITAVLKNRVEYVEKFSRKKFFIPAYLGPFNSEFSQTYIHRLGMNCIVTG